MTNAGPADQLSQFFTTLFPQLMDSLNQGNLSKCKELFASLAQKGLGWQEIDNLISEATKSDAEPEPDSDPDQQSTPWAFSSDILQNCAISGDMATFDYLIEEQKIPLDERALSAFIAACYFGHGFLVARFLNLPQFNASEEFLIEAKKHAVFANQEGISELLFPFLCKSIGIPNEGKEDFKKGLKLGKMTALSARNVTLKLHNILFEQKLEALHKLRSMVTTHIESGSLSAIIDELTQLTERSKDYFEKFKLFNACDTFRTDEFIQALISFFPTIDNNESEEIDNSNSAQEEDENEKKIVEQLKATLAFFSEEGERKIEKYLTSVNDFEEVQDFDLLFKEFFASYPQLVEHIAQGDLKEVMAFLSNWKEKGITIEKIDEKLTFLFGQASMFSQLLLGDIASLGQCEILAKMIEKENIPFNPIALDRAIRSNQAEMIAYLLKMTQLPPQLILMTLGLSLTLENATISEKLFEAFVAATKLSPSEAERNWNEMMRSKEDVQTMKRQAEENKMNLLKGAKDEGQRLLTLLTNMEGYGFSQLKNKADRLLKSAEMRISALRKANESNTPYSEITEIELIYLSLYITLSLNQARLEAASDEQEGKLKEAYKVAKNVLQKLLPESSQIAGLAALEDMPQQLHTTILREHGEDAIAPPDSDDIGLYQAVKDAYKDKFKERGFEAILADLKQYLKDQFVKEKLSETYDAATAVACYQNIHHSAWRYLLKPNPWISEKPQYAKDSAIIWDNHLEMLAYFWLAASDENTPCTDDITLTGRKDHFAGELMVLNREHNWDKKRLNEKTQQMEKYDDLKGDDPSCPGGVEKRTYQLLIGHPIINKVKPLTPQIMADKFKENFITETDGSSLFEKLARYSLDELSSLKSAIEEWVVNFGDVNKETRAVLDKLKINPDEFLVKQIECYGKRRLEKASFTYQRENFENYEKFILALSSSPLKYFGELISARVNTLLSKQANSNVAPIVTAYENYKTRPETSDNNSANDEAKPSNTLASSRVGPQ